MVREKKRPLKVFLCHASGDKPSVRDLYKRLTTEGVDAWLDKEKLLPGQDWRLEIPRAVQEADVVVVCLSNKSVTKEGYVQKEIKFALDSAEEKPEGAIFLIPARLEDCVVPERLSRWQWVDLYEENGFIQLLRSLKLRADAVGATVEPSSYVDSDKEAERRLDQLYTEGLAAFYTEDWDRACHRFQSILSERPSHKSAAEKLAEAERQRDLAKLYEQATEALRSEDWQTAIKTLEVLSQKSADYKDVTQLLRNARKRKQLKELYAEAEKLHAAQKWQAVVKVFEQISILEPNFPDVNGLLTSAEKEVAEIRRLEELNNQYAHALREMDAGNWREARRLLEQVHKAQTGFLETERLLRKVEDEISREEKKREQNDEINTLYEQAHGLLRSKKWRNALEKIELIRKLDDCFPDEDGIAEKAQKELAGEEQEAERQNKLAAIYAEAVKLLKEEKYQDALDQWQEVRAVDPKYPDRQWVQRTARKKLSEADTPAKNKSKFVIKRPLLAGIMGVAAIGVVIAGVILLGRKSQATLPTSTSAPTRNAIINPTLTMLPFKTSTPRPATPVPTISGYSDPTMYDDFGRKGFDNKYDTSLWGLYTDPNYEEQNSGYKINQLNGQLAIRIINGKGNLSQNSDSQALTQPMFVETRLYLDPATTDNGTHLYFMLIVGPGSSTCGIFSVAGKPNKQDIKCWSNYYDKKLELNAGKDNIEAGWHILRLEISPDPFEITFFVDGSAIGKFSPIESMPNHYDEIKSSSFFTNFGMHNFGSAKSPVGYIDYVRIGAIADDPILYDNFNNATYDGRLNTAKFAYEQHDSDGSVAQQNDVLVLTQSGIEKGQTLRANQYWPLKLTDSIVFEANLKSEMTNDGFVVLQLTGDVRASCGLHSMSDIVMAHCWTRTTDPAIGVAHRTWHTVRMEINLATNTITFYMDGKQLAEDHYERSLRGASVYLNIQVWAGKDRVNNTRPVIGYVDDVRIFPLEYISP